MGIARQGGKPFRGIRDIRVIAIVRVILIALKLHLCGHFRQYNVFSMVILKEASSHKHYRNQGDQKWLFHRQPLFRKMNPNFHFKKSNIRTIIGD